MMKQRRKKQILAACVDDDDAAMSIADQRNTGEALYDAS